MTRIPRRCLAAMLLIVPPCEGALHKSPPRPNGAQHLGFLDGFKGLAAQLIVLHHLAFYGPMSDHVRPVAPLLIGWLDVYARMAVQVFLVIGGFLAARSLCPDGVARPGGTPALTSLLARRYLKLAPPFIVAMLLASCASALASGWISHYSISAPTTLAQLAAHVMLAHDILGYEAISAGAWYVAIDFQLYALMAAAVWLCGRDGQGADDVRRPWLVPLLITLLAAASLLIFNRDAALDIWAPYFFGSYGLGALAWWARSGSAGRRQLLLAAMLVSTLLALAIDFRERIALAAVLALLLSFWRSSGRATLVTPLLGWLGRISYSVFLVHFPVCLLVNALFIRVMPGTAGWQGLGMLVAWVASVAAGAAFFSFVERPLGQWLSPARRVAAGRVGVTA
jgi:peptidoglycan/LPS O-acetylase OafA/YrhL